MNEEILMYLVFGVIGSLILMILLILIKRFLWWVLDIKPKEDPIVQQKKSLYNQLRGKQFRITKNNDGTWGTKSWGVKIIANSPEQVGEKLKNLKS